jgi:hypothetical protein
LRPRSFVLLECQRYATELLRLIEDQPNGLTPRLCRAPAPRICRAEGGLDRIIPFFGRDLDYRGTLDV